jgi:hypothetical protein
MVKKIDLKLYYLNILMSKKCVYCKSKLKIVHYNCRCSDSKKFCSKCRLPENHECDYDFQTNSKKILQKELIKVEYEKIIKI